MNTLELCKAKILVVDDTPANLHLLSKTLTECGYEVRGVVNGSMAIRAASSAKPDLILLDVCLPDISGYEICQQLKQDPTTAEIPIIFLSAVDEVLDKVKAFNVGAIDYITKPFQVEEVLARVKNHLSLQLAKAEITKLNDQLEQRVLRRTAELQAANQKLAQEVDKRKQAQKLLKHMALHDSLTNLPNRVLFTERLKQTIAQARQQEKHFAVLFLDCDRFKMVNDSLGHLVGDQLLVAVSRRIESCISSTDTLSRFGGDEFALLLDGVTKVEQASQTAIKIIRKLAQSFCLNQNQIFISASIGIVMGSSAYQEPEELLQDADTAMYRAKEAGKGCYQVFDASMRQQVVKQLQLETDLRLALEENQFVLHYQPIVSLATGELSGFEALLRWQHPGRGMISPAEFIPLIEETGLIIPVGLWVLRQACQQLAFWHRLSGNEHLTMSVNVSLKQFAQADLIEQIDAIVSSTGIKSSCLTLEITESAIMDNAQTAIEILRQLRQRQIKVSIDDFGTGYSSLSYLQRFAVDSLKIDRSFVRTIGNPDENLEIIRAILTLAKSMNINVVAEGIETVQQLAQLQQLECQNGQGYFFSKPLPADGATKIMQKRASKSSIASSNNPKAA